MVIDNLQKGIRYQLRNGAEIDGVIPTPFKELTDPRYCWMAVGSKYHGSTYMDNGRAFDGRTSAHDIVKALDHRVASDPEIADVKPFDQNEVLSQYAAMGADQERPVYRATITIQLVQADGATFEAQVPHALVADVGVITYYGALFVYQHSTVFHAKPRFIETQNAILNTTIFTQVSE